MADCIWLKAVHMAQMQADVDARQPEEACGLVAGRNLRAQIVYPVTNALHSPVCFRMEPAEQLRVFLEIETLGLELVAIYHSHPHGPPEPSPTDRRESAYPEVVHLIWCKQAGEWSCRAFWLGEQGSQELQIAILE